MARPKAVTVEQLSVPPELDMQEAENLADRPAEDQAGVKGFKYERNVFGHYAILWEDGSRDVPAELMGTWTSLSRARERVANYFATRRQPRTKPDLSE
jgi:hypothetical protein